MRYDSITFKPDRYWKPTQYAAAKSSRVPHAKRIFVNVGHINDFRTCYEARRPQDRLPHNPRPPKQQTSDGYFPPLAPPSRSPRVHRFPMPLLSPPDQSPLRRWCEVSKQPICEA